MWKAAEPDFVKMTEQKMEANRFMHYLGLRITRIEAGLVEGELELQQHHMQQMDFVHGGVTATIADIVAGFAAYTLVRHGQGMVTVDLKVSYLNPGFGNKLYARGSVIKSGQKLCFSEAEIWMMNQDKQVMIVKASGTFAILNPADMRS
jgi:uncharacterized protein (TIGR00369 family)